jgi:hypothetical protein
VTRAALQRQQATPDVTATLPRRIGRQVAGTDSAEDQLGAARARGTRDPWTEIAEILAGLLGDAASVTPSPTTFVQPTGSSTAADSDDAGATVTQDAAPVITSPPTPTGLPNTTTTQVLTGNATTPTPDTIDVPDFGSPTQVNLPAPNETPLAVATAQVTPTPAGDGGAGGGNDSGGSPRAVVRRWQGRVASAGTQLPQPHVAVPPAAAGAVATQVQSAEARNQAAQAQLPGEALSNVPAAPQVDDPPAPPPANPIPDQANRILALSNLRLPDQQVPALLPSPVRPVENDVSVGGTMPRAGDVPIDSEIFQMALSPSAAALAQPDPHAARIDGRPTPAERVQDALTQLRGDPRPAGQEGRGVQVIAPDIGPQPVPPLAEAMRVPVGEVVARLLADTDTAADQVLDGLRTEAYSGSVLKREFPTIGADMRGEIKGSITTELGEIAAAASVSAEQLQGMIAARRQALAAASTAAGREAADTAAAATRTATAAGQRTMDTVAGAADQADEETLRRQEAASGSSDPTVVNRRRDRTLDWVREQVTTQTSHYQEAGDRRARDLNAAQQQQADAYRSLVQREQYQVLTPSAPRPDRNPADRARENRLTDINAAIRAWSDERVRAIGTVFRQLIGDARTTTQTHRREIEGAGDRAIVATRQWADDKILEGQGWWSRFVGRIRNWLHGADQANQQWRVRRTREMRDSVANDLQLIARANALLASEVRREDILADQTLTEAQRATLRQYFEQPAGMHPLDFAAQRLRGRLVETRLAAARASFEQSVIATPVGDGDFATADKVNEVAKADGGGSGFDAGRLAQNLHGAMDQMGTDEAAIFSALRGLSPLRASAVRKSYYAYYGTSLDDDLDSELSGDEYRRAMAQLQGQVAAGDAIALHDAIAGPGTDEAAIFAVLANKSAVEAEAIRAEYLRRYGETLDDAIRGDMDPGNDRDRSMALLNGDPDTANAIAIDEAMRGGFLGLGTSEEEIEKVHTDMRAEVLARARSEGWSSAEMEAEIRRRNAELERRFGERYANVAQYRDEAGGGSILARAYRSELSGPQLDLANALQANDLTAADAARIRIEDDALVYASDDKINAVLQSQYDRALEARRLDEGPARNLRVSREVELWTREVPALSEEEISRRRMALERQMEREMADAAQTDSRAAMGRLDAAYGSAYNRTLDTVLATRTMATDQTAAFQRLRQGGRLTPLQTVEHATVSDGTDEAALHQLFSTMTLTEIRALRRQWEARHPGESFDAMLRSELGGRDESDIMDRVEHGAPESAAARLDEEQRRSSRELGELTGVLGGVAAGREARRLQYEQERLEALRTPLLRTTWPNTPEARAERARLRDQVDFRVQRVQDAVEDHRRRIDSVTDTATQVVGIVVGVVVGAIVTALSGGTMGPAAVAALSALISSLASTAATMATKQLIQGGSYSGEDMALDVTVGIVDAIASRGLAKYGLGGRLAGRIETLIARSRVGVMAARIAERGAQSGLAQRALRLPGAATVARAAGKMMPTRAGFERAAAHFVGEGLNDAVGALPSTLTQIALTDTTWEGDPLHAFLSGTGMAMLQAAAMGRMLEGGMAAASHAFVSTRSRVRMHSETGRLAEANRIILDSYGRFHADNPGASMADFLQHPDGRRMRAEIEQRGLLPTIETAAAHPVTTVRVDDQGNPRPATAAEIRADALESAIPKRLRDGASITADPGLTGRTVHVEPLRIGNQIVGVDVRVGPDATPLDIALHAGTIQAMQRYRGTLGNVRRALFDAFAIGGRSGLTVGSRGWEAQLEIAKLSAVIVSRMEGLAGHTPTPELQARVHADIQSLENQLLINRMILSDAGLRGTAGRGYVAAEDEGPPPPLTDLQRELLKQPHVAEAIAKIRKAYEDAIELSVGLRPRIDDDATPAVKEARGREAAKGFASALRAAHDAVTQLAKQTGISEAALIDQAAMVGYAHPVEKRQPYSDERVGAMAAAQRQELLLKALMEDFNLRGPDLEQRTLREMIAMLRRETGEKKKDTTRLEGRVPDAVTGVKLLRGHRPLGVDLEGFVPLNVLLENIQALDSLRTAIAAFKPDRVFGVQTGGWLMVESLVPPGQHQLPEHFNQVPKNTDTGNRREFLQPMIIDLILAGESRFMVADYYMGGGAIGDFNAMMVDIVNDPRVRQHLLDKGTTLHFETLWLRERETFERGSPIGQQSTEIRLENERQPPRPMVDLETKQVLAVFTKEVRNVQFVIGDDADRILKNTNLTDPNAPPQLAIQVFNQHGEVIQTLPVGLRHPATGELLDTARKVLAAILQGHQFLEIQAHQTARTVGTGQALYVQGTAKPGSSYFDNALDAQAVLDAVHANPALIVGRTANGDLIVQVDSVTGHSQNQEAGLPLQDTHRFFISGTSNPTVIPTNPNQE